MKFPDIRTLFTINLDSYLGANSSAYGATSAFLFFIRADRMVTIEIVFFCGNNMAFGTKMNTKQAFFAYFFINFNRSLQNQSPKNLLGPLSCL